MQNTRPSLLIIYGSQTGNAQDAAERVAREAKRRHFHPRLLSADTISSSPIMLSNLPQEPAIIFIISTTGQGEPPSNFKPLWKFLLKKSLPPDSLAACNVAIFGLGDSGYIQYNVMAKKVFRRLQALGANTSLAPLGLGDDQHRSGYEAGLDAWLPVLWEALSKQFPLIAVGGTTSDGGGTALLIEPPHDDMSTEIIPKYTIEWLDTSSSAISSLIGINNNNYYSINDHQRAVEAAVGFAKVEAAASGAPIVTIPTNDSETSTSIVKHNYGPMNPFFATLTFNKRITAEDHFQDVRQLEFDLSGYPSQHDEEEDGVMYQPGDVLAILPKQSAQAVDAFLARCNLDPNAWVRITPDTTASASGDGDGMLNDYGTGATSSSSVVVQVGSLVAGALDISGASPRRYLFQVMAQLSPSELERERLSYFSSPQGSSDLYDYNKREGRTVLEILSDFKATTTALGLEWLLTCCPRLKPRYFSIASSQRAHPKVAQLDVAIVRWTTPLKRIRKGICSTWLAYLESGDRVPVWLEKGALRLPPSLAKMSMLKCSGEQQTITTLPPLIMIGPGTGVAPFRSFLQDIDSQLQTAPSASLPYVPVPPPCLLFFGCRNKAHDYYHEEEWTAMSQPGRVLSTAPGGVITAFSRDQEGKDYVQHKIKGCAARRVWEMLERGAWVYVAGSAEKMPQDVFSALVEVVKEEGGMHGEDARKYLKQKELKGQYQVECWS